MWIRDGHYATWAAFLDEWGAGAAVDPATLPALTVEDFAGDSWERLTDRITGALSRRLQAWGQTLSRELSAATSEFDAARALNHARWSLVPIRGLAGAPAIPDELRGRLVEMVDTQIRSSQQQLD